MAKRFLSHPPVIVVGMVSGSVLVEADGFVYADRVDYAESEVRRLETHIRRLRARQAELLAELDQHQVFHVEGARTMAD